MTSLYLSYLNTFCPVIENLVYRDCKKLQSNDGMCQGDQRHPENSLSCDRNSCLKGLNTFQTRDRNFNVLA